MFIMSRDVQATPAMDSPTTAVFVVGAPGGGDSNGNKIAVYVCNEKNTEAWNNRVRVLVVLLAVSVEAWRH
jgi:hypothetical protein